MGSLSLNASRCAACEICVLICAYHHTGQFGRRVSSLKVSKNEATGTVRLSLVGETEGGAPTCDLCAGEADGPFCVAWCPVDAIRVEEAGP